MLHHNSKMLDMTEANEASLIINLSISSSISIVSIINIDIVI